MITALIVVTTIILVGLQVWKDNIKDADDAEKDATNLAKSNEIIDLQRENKERSREFEREQKKLIELQTLVSTKADSLDQKQNSLNNLYEKLLGKYDDVVQQQRTANDLQTALNNFVTGGINKPRIEVGPQPVFPMKGFENAPRQYRRDYKAVIFSIKNTGSHRLRNVSVVMFGGLGLNITGQGEFVRKDTLLPYYIQSDAFTLDPGVSINFHTGRYEANNSGLYCTFLIMWEGGFYTMKALYMYQHPRNPKLDLQEVTYSVGNRVITDANEFFRN